MSIVNVLFQSINLLLVVAWVILTLVALFQLKGKSLPATAKVLWVMVICCIPLLGAIAFFIIQPANEGPSHL